MGNQTTFPDDVIRALVFVLSNTSFDIGSPSVNAILKQDRLYADFPKLGREDFMVVIRKYSVDEAFVGN